MITTLLFYFFLHPLLLKSQRLEPYSLWCKHYLTYSIENDFNNTEEIKKAVQEWDISPILEWEHVPQGQGDIKFYFVDTLPNNVSGRGMLPELGIIKINRLVYNISDINITKVYQHEFGHALGMQHDPYYFSIMYFIHTPFRKILKHDKRWLKEYYKCRYDSVTLLSNQTFVKFRGRYFEMLDLQTENVSNGTLWHPSITKVTTMYRKNNHYYIIQDKKYYKFDMSLQFKKMGRINEILPNFAHNLSSVLTLQNGSMIYFLEGNYTWYGNIERYQRFNGIYPKSFIQGSYWDTDKIYLFSKDDLFVYDENFKLLNKTRICDDAKLSKIHCCNKYSKLEGFGPRFEVLVNRYD